ncbi:MAG TPA: hypothetical protein VGC81_10115 [Candidatus Methylomirabilis sp.]
MPQKTEAHIMLPLPLEIADETVNGGRQKFLGVHGDTVLADLEVQMRPAGPPGLTDTASHLDPANRPHPT